MMSRIKKHVIGVLAAATVAAAGFAATPPASAMPMSCVTRLALSYHYMATGHAFWAIGNYQKATDWYYKAQTVLNGC